MNPQFHVLLIGVDPVLIDMSSPDFASMPGLTPDIVEQGTKLALEELRALGYDAEKCWIDLGATAEQTIIQRLAANTYDAIIIGAGIRVPAGNLLLFELVLNVVHRHAPKARIVFNTSPKDNVAALKRWL